LIWGAAALAGISGLALALMPKPLPVDLETLARGPLRVTLDHEGRTRVRDPYVVSSPIAGRVERIVLEPGDAVVQGQVVALIEPNAPDPLDTRARAEAAAAAAAAGARVTAARAEVDRAKSDLALAEADRVRAESLAAAQVVSARDLQAAETAAQSAAEALSMAEAASRAAAFELEAARARLARPVGSASASSQEKEARAVSSATEVLAPIDGVVLRRLRQSASVVPRGEPLLEIGAPEGLEVVADYLSTDAAQIRPGMTALLERWGGDGALQGRVRRVDPAGFTKISALGVEEQRVNVVVDLVDPRSVWTSLGEGFRVEVRIVAWEEAEVLTVPASSLFRHDGGWAVFQLEGSRVRISPVEVGRSDGRRSQVLSGLGAGDAVVTHPPEALADGMRVEERSPRG
jgi:HlyD family secretion protein